MIQSLKKELCFISNISKVKGLEDTEGDFKYDGWQATFEDDDDSMYPNLGEAGTLLLSRKTYDIFASYWPTVGKDIEWYGSWSGWS